MLNFIGDMEVWSNYLYYFKMLIKESNNNNLLIYSKTFDYAMKSITMIFAMFLVFGLIFST